MRWFNGYGAIFVFLLLVPNIVFAMTHKDGFENHWRNRMVEILEQIGRFGSFCFMFLCLSFACRGWWFDGAKAVYLSLGTVLVFLSVSYGVDPAMERGFRAEVALALCSAVAPVSGERDPDGKYPADPCGGSVCAVSHHDQLSERQKKRLVCRTDPEKPVAFYRAQK